VRGHHMSVGSHKLLPASECCGQRVVVSVLEHPKVWKVYGRDMARVTGGIGVDSVGAHGSREDGCGGGDGIGEVHIKGAKGWGCSSGSLVSNVDGSWGGGSRAIGVVRVSWAPLLNMVVGAGGISKVVASFVVGLGGVDGAMFRSCVPGSGGIRRRRVRDEQRARYGGLFAGGRIGRERAKLFVRGWCRRRQWWWLWSPPETAVVIAVASEGPHSLPLSGLPIQVFQLL